jgi:hypothetical protein
MLNGDVGATQQVHMLTGQIAAGSPADLAMANIVPDGHIDSGPGASLRDQISAVESMRATGFDDATIAQVAIREQECAIISTTCGRPLCA